MISISHNEAQLFRMLVGFFGEDRVVPQMSVNCVCGGALPSEILRQERDLESWAHNCKCLFTIVDPQDNPKLVIEFMSDFKEIIDLKELEHRQYLPRVLGAAGVHYITISPAEFSEMLNPNSSLDIFTLLKAKFEDSLDSSVA